MYVSNVQPRRSYGAVGAVPAYTQSGLYGSGYAGAGVIQAPVIYGGDGLIQGGLIQGGYVGGAGLVQSGSFAPVRHSYGAVRGVEAEQNIRPAAVVDSVPLSSVNYVSRDYGSYGPQSRYDKEVQYQTVKKVEYTPVRKTEYIPVERIEMKESVTEEKVPIEYYPMQQQFVQQPVYAAPRIVQSGYAVHQNPAMVATTYIKNERVQEVPCPCEIFDVTFPRKDYAYRDRLVYGTNRGSKLRGGLTPWDKYDRALHKMRKEVGYEKKNPDNYLHTLDY
jgi:hypothetical protein